MVLQGRSRVDAAATQPRENRLRSGQAQSWSKQEGHNLDPDQSWTKWICANLNSESGQYGPVTVPTLTNDSTIRDLRARGRHSPGNPQWNSTRGHNGYCPHGLRYSVQGWLRKLVSWPTEGMVTNGGLREQEVRQLEIRVKGRGWRSRKTPEARDSVRLPDTASGQLTAVSCQYGATTPRPLGAALMGIGTSEARGGAGKQAARRCSTTFRPPAVRSSLRGHLNCQQRAVPETCSAAVRSDLPARWRPTAGKE